MEKDKIFFGEQGLTSTSANHIANMAKELITNIEQELASVEFYTTSIEVIGSGKESVLRIGTGVETLNAIQSKLDTVAQSKALIAWLREAIKAKDKLTEEVKSITMGEYCKLTEQDVPKVPLREPFLTKDDIIATLSVKERNDYYSLEAKAATIGKYIHSDGAFAIARKNLQKHAQNPKEAVGSGRDTTIRTYTPSVTVEHVDAVFFEMQKEHRAIQARLNSILHKIEVQIQQDELGKQNVYNQAYDEYSEANKKIVNELMRYRMQQLKAIQKLRIIIPNDLRPIYEHINKVGTMKL